MEKQEFITFDIIQNGDMFSTNYSIAYKVVLESRKIDKKKIICTQSETDDKTAISKAKLSIVRREILAVIDKMYNVRANSHIVGYLPSHILVKIPRLDNRISNLKTFTDFTMFIGFVSGSILPILDEIKPSENSRHQKNYLTRLNALKSFCEAYLNWYEKQTILKAS